MAALKLKSVALYYGAERCPIDLVESGLPLEIEATHAAVGDIRETIEREVCRLAGGFKLRIKRVVVQRDPRRLHGFYMAPCVCVMGHGFRITWRGE